MRNQHRGSRLQPRTPGPSGSWVRGTNPTLDRGAYVCRYEARAGGRGRWWSKRVAAEYPNSDGNEVEVVIEASEVVRIGGEHSGPTITRRDSHGSIDDIAG